MTRIDRVLASLVTAFAVLCGVSLALGQEGDRQKDFTITVPVDIKDIEGVSKLKLVCSVLAPNNIQVCDMEKEIPNTHEFKGDITLACDAEEGKNPSAADTWECFLDASNSEGTVFFDFCSEEKEKGIVCLRNGTKRVVEVTGNI